MEKGIIDRITKQDGECTFEDANCNKTQPPPEGSC